MSGMNLEGIEKALDDGLVVEASAGGGHLRIVRIINPRLQGDAAVRVYDEMAYLEGALECASLAYQQNIARPPCRFDFGAGSGVDRLDGWVFHGHRLHAERTNGRVTIEARSWDNQTIVAATGSDFRSAYASLGEKIDEEAFERADQF
jgi:hypothetical protein